MINLSYFNDALRFKSQDFVSLLGIANMSGTWDLGPMWTDP